MRIIRGKFGRRRFDVPTNISARPTTDFARENIFNVLENIIDFDGLHALDLFAGTGAISFELLSRECESVTCVEKTATQYNFIRKVKEQLNVPNFTMVKGDAFRFIQNTSTKFDFIFADPPYDLPNFGDVPRLILQSKMLKPGTVVVVEHSRNYNFTELPHFDQQRTYGSVNFSIFIIGEDYEKEISDDDINK